MGLFSSSSPGQATAPDEEKIVELACVCGEKVRGIRAARPRKLVCKRCGTPLFLLPRSPYPPPRPFTKSSVKSGSKSSKKSGSKGKRKSGRSRQRQTAGSIFGSILGFILFPFVWVGVQIRTAASSAVRWMIRPLHLAIILTVVILSTTGYFTYRKLQYDRANSLLTTLPEESDRLLNEGKISEAADLMKKVSAAVTTTNRKDDEARRLKQLASELEAVRNLSPGAIEEIVTRATDASTGWGEIFARTYSGQWIIVDTTAISEEEHGRARVDISLTVNANPVRLVVDLPSLGKTKDEEIPLRSIFAARIYNCVSEGKFGWKIGLDSDSIVYLTDRRVYDSLKMRTGDDTLDRETDRLLDHQAKILEVSK